MKVQVCLSSVGVLLGDEFGFRKQKISCEYHMSGIASLPPRLVSLAVEVKSTSHLRV